MGEELERLRNDMQALQGALAAEKERSTQMQMEAAAAKAEVDRMVQLERGKSTSTVSSTATIDHPLYVASTRRIDRFRDRPEKDSDPTIHEWICDIKGQIASRHLPFDEQASFIVEHLAGKARQEILGRGSSVLTDPSQIFAILNKVFGDGDTLPQLQQRFFSFRQGDEDLLTCSLKLVELYDKIIEQDKSFQPCRVSALKGRLAEAVRDEGLKRELRRLNIESPALSFFDMRDRAIEWLGTPGRSTQKKEVSVRETQASDLHALMQRQAEQLNAQQKQLDKLITLVSTQHKGPRTRNQNSNSRECWKCQEVGHFKRDCPQLVKAAVASKAEKDSGNY